MRHSSHVRASIAGAAVAALALTACGSSSAASTSGSSASASSGQSVVVGGATYTEMAIMEQMYKQLLEKAGFKVTLKTADQREIYAKSLVSGEIGVVPEYAATMAEYLNKQANGPDAAAIATPDADATVTAMQPLAEKQGLKVLKPSKALDSNGFYVTKKFADDKGIKTLSEYGALGVDTVLAAGDECLDPARIYCAPGLQKTYNIKVSSVTGDQFGSPSGKQKVVSGQAQMGETGTTDGTLKGLGLVVLEDDKKLQAADNLVPIVNAKVAGSAKIADTLNKLANVLTTDDLFTLNGQVDSERQKPEDVAKKFLQDKKLV